MCARHCRLCCRVHDIGGELVKPLLETREQVGELEFFATSLRRESCGPSPCYLIDTASKIVESMMQIGKIIGGSFVAAARNRRRLDSLRRGLLQDDCVEPVIQRQARTTRRFLRCVSRFRSDAFDAPRKAKCHAHTYVRGGDGKSRIDSRGTGAD